jgi:predicted nucleotidyltransferase
MDIENLLKLLKEHKVRFVLIGAMAFPLYGYSRTTLDTDIFIDPTEENAKRTLKALKKFGYDVSDITLSELLTKKLLIRQYSIETDIHPFVTGTDFKKVWKNKKTGKIGGIAVNFASLDDLIQMKKAAGREKDKADLKILRKLKKTKE